MTGEGFDDGVEALPLNCNKGRTEGGGSGSVSPGHHVKKGITNRQKYQFLTKISIIFRSVAGYPGALPVLCAPLTVMPSSLPVVSTLRGFRRYQRVSDGFSPLSQNRKIPTSLTLDLSSCVAVLRYNSDKIYMFSI